MIATFFFGPAIPLAPSAPAWMEESFTPTEFALSGALILVGQCPLRPLGAEEGKVFLTRRFKSPGYGYGTGGEGT